MKKNNNASVVPHTFLSYFRISSENQIVAQRITASLENPLSKAFLMCLSEALPFINIFNKVMQR